MAAAVMGDAAVSVVTEEEHLVFPGVRAQRPAKAEDDGLPRPPVLVIDLRAVFGRDRWHGMLSFLWFEDAEALPAREVLPSGTCRVENPKNKGQSTS
jgi:hypothetical protein